MRFDHLTLKHRWRHPLSIWCSRLWGCHWLSVATWDLWTCVILVSYPLADSTSGNSSTTLWMQEDLLWFVPACSLLHQRIINQSSFHHWFFFFSKLKCHDFLLNCVRERERRWVICAEVRCVCCVVELLVDFHQCCVVLCVSCSPMATTWETILTCGNHHLTPCPHMVHP